MFVVWKKLKLLEAKVRRMSKKFSSLETKLLSLRTNLQQFQDKLNDNFFNPQLIDAEKEVLVHLKKWEAINEGVLRQKSRATWISGGDATVKYFHALESQTGKVQGGPFLFSMNF